MNIQAGSLQSYILKLYRRQFKPWHKYSILLSLAIFVFVLRYNITATCLVLQTYLTWNWTTSRTDFIGFGDQFDKTFESYPINQTIPAKGFPSVVPAILHHIFIGDTDLATRPDWIASRQSCIDLHPDYQHILWGNSEAEEFLKRDFPWFYDSWLSYPYTVQRADSLRYLLLYSYGGIFLDMDLECKRALGPLRRFEFVAIEAFPVGISNGFLMAAPGHPLLKNLVEGLELFNRNFLFSPFITVMFSAGPMFISSYISRFSERWKVKILADSFHAAKNGPVETKLFIHGGGKSWHTGDAVFLGHVGGYLEDFPSRHPVLLFFLMLLAAMPVGVLARLLWRRRHSYNKIRQMEDSNP